MPRYMIMLVNGCESDDYSPEVTTFRPYDACNPNHVPEALMNELTALLTPESQVLVYILIDPETWVYPSFSHAEGVDPVGLLFNLETENEFKIWQKNPELLQPYRQRVFEAHKERTIQEREMRENAVTQLKRARVNESELKKDIMLEILNNE